MAMWHLAVLFAARQAIMIRSNESARGIMELTVKNRLAIGNGIITVENWDQAWARARMSEKDKGGDAARAALAMAQIAKNFGIEA